MTSRFDKLYELLESNNPAIRSATVIQIGQISNNSNVKLSVLFNKLLPYIKHKMWYVRIAATDALKEIGMNMKPWIPNRYIINTHAKNSHGAMISLNKLDILKILDFATRLYSSDNFDNETDGTSLSNAKDELNKHLGLSLSEFEMKPEEFLTVDDYKSDENISRDIKNNLSIADAINYSMSGEDIKYGVKRPYEEDNSTCLVKKVKYDLESNNDDSKWSWCDLCDELLSGLWDRTWQIRHGCAVGLREIVRTQGAIMVANKWNNIDAGDYSDFQTAHNQYVEDVLGRLLCTLGLDQVSDFVSDEVVAPVRESCAQTIGLLSVHCDKQLILMIIRHLMILLHHKEWTVCHGALLTIKYILAARADLLESLLLPQLYLSVSSFLRSSSDDDIRCASASALMPLFGATLTSDIHKIIDVLSLRNDLWYVLSSEMEYAGAILQLIERLYSSFNISINEQPNLEIIQENIGKLHCCYFNYSEDIRLYALKAMSSFLKYYYSQLNTLPCDFWCGFLSQLVQRILVDDSTEVSHHAEQLWIWTVDHLNVDILMRSCVDKYDQWLCMAMQPSRMPFGNNMISLPVNMQSADECFIAGKQLYLSEGDSNLREETVLAARISCCRALGYILNRILPSDNEEIQQHFLCKIFIEIHLEDKIAVQRFVAATTLVYAQLKDMSYLDLLKQKLLADLKQPLYYEEILPKYKLMLKCCRDLVELYKDQNLEYKIDGNINYNSSMNIQQCKSIVRQELFHQLVAQNSFKEENKDKYESIYAQAQSSVDSCVTFHLELSRLVDVSLVRALLSLDTMADKLTPMIKPLIDTIRLDWRVCLQNEAALCLSNLLVRKSQVNLSSFTKLMRNLCNYYSEAIDKVGITIEDSFGSVVSLLVIEQLGRDKFPAQEALANQDSQDEDNTNTSPSAIFCQLRGCKLALSQISNELSMADNIEHNQHIDKACATILVDVVFNETMQCLQNVSSSNGNKEENSSDILKLLSGLRAAEIVITNTDRTVIHTMIQQLPQFAQSVSENGLSHYSSLVRHWSARLLAVLIMPIDIIQSNLTDSQIAVCYQTYMSSIVFDCVLPELEKLSNEQRSLGCIELLYMIMQRGYLGYRLSMIVCVLPVVLRCCNCCIASIRHLATQIFSQILSLMPLELHNSNLTLLNLPRITDIRQKNRHFIKALMKPESINTFDVSDVLTQSISLRHYQQLGVNWLAFLFKYGLHGILADDMGLGKTLQTLCIIAGQRHHRLMQDPKQIIPASIIVCPSTLTKHWLQEVQRYICLKNFSSVIYAGNGESRQNLLKQLHSYQLVITSYDVLRNDCELLIKPTNANSWDYLVLDEGHLIRNHKSKVALATKSIMANHRLVLTGTPIQNNVSELWSIFDFLMPGLLGDKHSIFQKKFARHLSNTGNNASGYCSISANSNKSNTTSMKSTSKQENNYSDQCTLALDALHKQVLPFILRRIKDDVLSELPPKIMQDYSCVMSKVQVIIYNIINRTSNDSCNSTLANSSIEDSIENNQLTNRKHVFQAIHRLKLVCNHPSLLIGLLKNNVGQQEDVELYRKLMNSIDSELKSHNLHLGDLELSGKLMALKQLIIDCGIGINACVNNKSGTYGNNGSSNFVVSGHRLLIFCQSKAMIQLIEKMLSNNMKLTAGSSFLKLDGSINVKDRQLIVDKFNEDPSIDILLLTTSIGGLGLNLTSADTVIFAEHDWNPMRDLQAMDRAHRLGQSKTVNVYRLITADSIEERIMNLQQFKMFVAESVVSGTNLNPSSDNNPSLLDIMNKAELQQQTEAKSGKLPVKDVLKTLDSMYNTTSDYEDQFNIDKFLDSIKQ